MDNSVLIVRKERVEKEPTMHQKEKESKYNGKMGRRDIKQ